MALVLLPWVRSAVEVEVLVSLNEVRIGSPGIWASPDADERFPTPSAWAWRLPQGCAPHAKLVRMRASWCRAKKRLKLCATWT